MRRKEDYPLQKVTLNLRDGDFEYLRDLHGKVGAGKIIRNLVIKHIKTVQEKVALEEHLSTDNVKIEEDIT
jgi:hypothetical protein